MNKRKFISLFSGAMGLDIGLEKSKHWKCVFCLDNDKNTIKTIRINRSNLPTIEDSIENINGKLIRKIINKKKGEDLDLIVGGPPCQSFSVFGSREGIKDVRGQLVFEFLRLIKDLKPKMFLMENVRGLLSMPIIPKKYQKSLNNQKVQCLNMGL